MAGALLPNPQPVRVYPMALGGGVGWSLMSQWAAARLAGPTGQSSPGTDPCLISRGGRSHESGSGHAVAPGPWGAPSSLGLLPLSVQLQPPHPERWQQGQVWCQVCGMVAQPQSSTSCTGLGGLDEGPSDCGWVRPSHSWLLRPRGPMGLVWAALSSSTAQEVPGTFTCGVGVGHRCASSRILVDRNPP